MKINIKGILEKGEEHKTLKQEVEEQLEHEREQVSVDAANEPAADADANTDAKAGTGPDTNADPDPDSKANPDTDAHNELAANAEANTDAEADPNPDTNADPAPDSKANPDTDAHNEPAADAEANTDAEADPNPDTNADPDPDSKANPDTDAHNEPATDADANTDAEADTDPDTNADPAPDADDPHEVEDEESHSDQKANPEVKELSDTKPKAKHTFEPKKYIEMAAIAAAFIVLVCVMLYYTNMVPREVYAAIDGEPQIITSKAWTVEEFLETENIDYCSDDYISVPLTAFIHQDMNLEIRHATNYKITADGETKSYKTLERTVGAALQEENIRLGEKDIVEPGVDKPIRENMTIIVKRVVIKEKTVVEKIPYKTITQEDSSMDEGTKKVVRKGKNGKAKVTYKITYTDGKQTSKKKIKTKIITPKRNKIVKVGTKATIDGFAYTRTITVKAYAYTGGGRTAMGTSARVGEIAVDPSVIPLGTSVYIEGVGVRRAEDTGGNIQGNTIDIYMNSEAECRNWGVRYLTVYLP